MCIVFECVCGCACVFCVRQVYLAKEADMLRILCKVFSLERKEVEKRRSILILEPDSLQVFLIGRGLFAFFFFFFFEVAYTGIYTYIVIIYTLVPCALAYMLSSERGMPAEWELPGV